MIFASIDCALFRVIAVDLAPNNNRFVLVGSDGILYGGLWPNDKWKFYTGYEAVLLTLIYGRDYPYPVKGRVFSYAHWHWGLGTIAAAISRNDISRTEAQKASRRASDFC